MAPHLACVELGIGSGQLVLLVELGQILQDGVVLVKSERRSRVLDAAFPAQIIHEVKLFRLLHSH